MISGELEKLAPLMDRARAEGWAEWVRDERDQLAMLDGCWFDLDAAERFRDFCSKFLRIENPDPKRGAKLIPFELLDFQYRDVLGPLFGWKREDGSRRYRFGFVSVAKGNTKSAMAAAVLLFLVFADGESSALGYAASTSAHAARTVWEFAARMVQNSPALSKRLRVIPHTGRIVDDSRGHVLSIIPNRPDAIEGKNVAVCVYDELHLAHDRKLWEAIEHGGRSRRQPLVLVITTASSDEQSIAFELYQDAKRLISGEVVDHSRFAYIAEAMRDDDPMDPAVWRKANPALGTTVNQTDFAEKAQLSQDSPAKLVNFQKRRLNVWGLAGAESFIDFAKWKACRADVDADELAGRECYLGLDLSSNVDLTAVVAVFPGADESVDVLAWHWLPRENLTERTKDFDRYPEMVERGHLLLTEGDYIDQPAIRQHVRMLGEKYKVREVAYDPTFAADLGPKLMSDGFDIFQFWQRATMYSPVLAKLDALVRAGKIRHNNPLLDWQIGNLEVKTNEDGFMKPVKARVGKKIDGVCALLMALGKIVKQEKSEAPVTTWFDSHDLELWR